MINHHVFLEFKSTVSEAQVTQVLNQLGALKADIPSMTHFSFGKNCSIENLHKGFTHAMLITFNDVEGRNAYVNHPMHRHVAFEIIVPMLANGVESAIVIDYEY